MVRRLIICVAALFVSATAQAQQAGDSGRGSALPSLEPGAASAGPQPALDARLLYSGWRARDLIGEQAMDPGGRQIGVIQDMIIDADGRLAAAVLEGGGVAGIPDTVYRVPWQFVRDVPGGGVRIDVSPDGRLPEYTFPIANGIPTWPREYRVSEVIGDAVRLRTGYMYGTVTDVVFDRSGRTTAVIVVGTPGLGTAQDRVAFPFDGMTGNWDPGASYFGLPFVVPEQARQVAVEVDRSRFESGAATGGG